MVPSPAVKAVPLPDTFCRCQVLLPEVKSKLYLVGEVESTFLQHVIDVFGMEGLANYKVSPVVCLLLLVANRSGRGWLGSSFGIIPVLMNEPATGGRRGQNGEKVKFFIPIDVVLR